MNEAKAANESMQRGNACFEEKLTEHLSEKRTAENIELVELRRTMVECEIELHELRDQYLSLKSKAENDLNNEHKKIGVISIKRRLTQFIKIILISDELTQIVQKEMDRNKSLSKDLQSLRNATETIEVHNKTSVEMVYGFALMTDLSKL